MGETRITGLLEGEDVLRRAAAMRALGAQIRRRRTKAPGWWRHAASAAWRTGDVLDLGNAGTGVRLLCGVLASHQLFAVMTGDASLRRRPMRRVIDPLTACATPAPTSVT